MSKIMVRYWRFPPMVRALLVVTLMILVLVAHCLIYYAMWRVWTDLRPFAKNDWTLFGLIWLLLMGVERVLVSQFKFFIKPFIGTQHS